MTSLSRHRWLLLPRSLMLHARQDWRLGEGSEVAELIEELEKAGCALKRAEVMISSTLVRRLQPAWSLAALLPPPPQKADETAQLLGFSPFCVSSCVYPIG